MAFEMARCFKCKRYRQAEELVLNRTNWEYECKDTYLCEQVLNDNPDYNSEKKRADYKKRNLGRKRKPPTQISKEWNRL